MTGPRVAEHAELVERARKLAAAPSRQLLGLTGPPGAGKSTLATALVEGLAGAGVPAALVPMDGFHRSNEELERMGRRDRKGAADTFDADAYAQLLRRLRDAPPERVLAPGFDRDAEETVPDAIVVPGDATLVVTEGNYLLVGGGPWAQVRPLLDEVWYVDLPAAARVDRLVARHVRHGRSAQEARRWVDGNDELNAAVIERTRERADLIVTL